VICPFRAVERVRVPKTPKPENFCIDSSAFSKIVQSRAVTIVTSSSIHDTMSRIEASRSLHARIGDEQMNQNLLRSSLMTVQFGLYIYRSIGLLSLRCEQ